MELVVNDTNIFFDLIHANLLNEFFQLDIEVYTTDLIIAEIEEPEQIVLINSFIDEGKLSVDSMNFDALENLYTMQEEHNGLSIEDCSVWYYSKQHNFTLLSGDGLLRRTASRDGVVVKGLLYVFDRLVENDLIPSNIAADKLELLLAKGTRLPKAECDKRLQEWRN